MRRISLLQDRFPKILEQSYAHLKVRDLYSLLCTTPSNWRSTLPNIPPIRNFLTFQMYNCAIQIIKIPCFAFWHIPTLLHTQSCWWQILSPVVNFSNARITVQSFRKLPVLKHIWICGITFPRLRPYCIWYTFLSTGTFSQRELKTAI